MKRGTISGTIILVIIAMVIIFFGEWDDDEQQQEDDITDNSNVGTTPDENIVDCDIDDGNVIIPHYVGGIWHQ